MKNISLLLVFGMLIFAGCIGQGETTKSSGGSSDGITLSLSDVSTTVKQYTYDSNGVQIQYFAVKGSDGKVRTAFNACEVCYRSKKGYTQIGTDVRCNNCGLRFKIDELGTANKGKGCWPAYLPNEVHGNKIIIKKIDLEKGEYFFS